jgi:DNA-binding MarR family transcriptional regulator
VKRSIEQHQTRAAGFAPIRVGEDFAGFFPDAAPDAVEAVLNVLKTATMIQAQVALLVREYGLTVATFSVLDALSSAGEPLTPVAISRRLLVPAQTLTNLLDALERQGLVRRLANQADRRSILVAITPEGEEVLHAACRPVVRSENAWLACLKPAERETLIQLLGRIQTQLEASGG